MKTRKRNFSSNKKISFEQGQISPDPEKIKLVENLKNPQTIKQLRGILGLMSYFRKFIWNYSQEAKPLTDLILANSQNITWSIKAQGSLDYLKKSTCFRIYQIITRFPNRKIRCYIRCLNQGIPNNKQIGSRIINGEEKVITYASRTLNPEESNYSAAQLELLSIIHHLDKFRLYLLGTNFKLSLDHESLQYLQTFKKPTGILARWILKIQYLDYELEYLKGKNAIPLENETEEITQ